MVKPNVGAAPGTARLRSQQLLHHERQPHPAADKLSVKCDQYIKENGPRRLLLRLEGTSRRPARTVRRRCPGYYSDYNDLNRRSNVYRFTLGPQLQRRLS